MKQTQACCSIVDPGAPDEANPGQLVANPAFVSTAVCGQMSSKLCELLDELGLTRFGLVTHAAVIPVKHTEPDEPTVAAIKLTIVMRINPTDLPSYQDLLTQVITQFVDAHPEWASRAQVSELQDETPAELLAAFRAGLAFGDDRGIVLYVPRVEEPYPVLTREQLDAMVNTGQSTPVTAGSLNIGDVCIPADFPAGINHHIADPQTPCYVTTKRDRFVQVSYPLTIDDRPHMVGAWIHIDSKVTVYQSAATSAITDSPQ